MKDEDKKKEHLINELHHLRRRVSELEAANTERKRAEEPPRKEKHAVQRLADEREIVAKIGRVIGSTLEIEKVYEQFAEEVKKLIPFERITINVIDHEAGTFSNAYILGEDVEGRRPGDVTPLAGSFTEEVLQKRSSQLIQTDSREEVADRFPRLLPNFQAGLRSFMAVPLISKDQVIGVLHMLSTKVNAYTRADVELAESIGSQIAGAIANAQLYAERKRAEEALKDSEEKFRTLAEQSPNMIFINKVGRVVYANEKCEEIMGYPREEFYSPDFDFLCLIAPEYVELIKSSFGEHMNGQEVEPCEYALVTKDGKRIDSILNTRLISYEGERAILGTVTDITERKRAEEELKKSEERYRSLVEDINDGYFVIQDGKFTYINQAFADLWGDTREVMLEREVSSFFPQKYLKKLSRNNVKGKGHRKLVVQNEFEISGKDGENVVLEIRTRVIDYDGGSAIAGICKNITERKKAEMALNEKVEELEKWYQLTVDREIKMIQLKNRIQELESEVRTKRA